MQALKEALESGSSTSGLHTLVTPSGDQPHEMPERARLSIDENEATPKALPETVPQCSQQEVMEDHPSDPMEASDFDVGGNMQMLDSDDKCSSCLSLKNENRQLQNRVKTLREKLKNKREDLRKVQTKLNGEL